MILLVAFCAAVACAGPGPTAPAEVRFTPVALPQGAVPEALAAAGDRLLIGLRRDGQPTQPGLLRRAADGAVTEVPVQAATGYGRMASWYSLAASVDGNGDRVLGIGGDRGGAHGNVRWSVWTGSTAGVAEHAQAFSTFGGWGAGDLTDAVLTPGGSAVVGSWQSDDTGQDVAVWTPDGDAWVRRSSTGTPLQSTRAAQGFATAATAFGPGVLVAGWGIATDTGQVPLVWQSGPDASGWRKTTLPDAGKAGAAAAVRCAASTCAVAGRVDGTLALWQMTDQRWSRLSGLPPIAVGDNDRLAAPLSPDGPVTEIVADQGQVKIVEAAGETTTVRTAAGPTGVVTAAVQVGPSVFVIAGDPAAPTLWQADAAALR